MIDAYYSRGCDSATLFDDTAIAKSEDYRKYMNQYNVIHIGRIRHLLRPLTHLLIWIMKV